MRLPAEILPSSKGRTGSKPTMKQSLIRRTSTLTGINPGGSIEVAGALSATPLMSMATFLFPLEAPFFAGFADF